VVRSHHLSLSTGPRSRHPYLEQLLLSPLAVTGLLAVAVVWVTSPPDPTLQLLASATRSITEGNWTKKLTLAGEDEVGQLGRALSKCQSSLKDRLGRAFRCYCASARQCRAAWI